MHSGCRSGWAFSAVVAIAGASEAALASSSEHVFVLFIDSLRGKLQLFPRVLGTGRGCMSPQSIVSLGGASTRSKLSSLDCACTYCGLASRSLNLPTKGSSRLMQI